MTAALVVAVSPEVAAILATRGEVWVGGLDTTCPTCRGFRGRRVARGLWSEWVDCPTCNGTGHLSPPSGPVPIGTTSTPTWDPTGEPDGPGSPDDRYGAHPCSIIGTADVETMPIVERQASSATLGSHVVLYAGSMFICDHATETWNNISGWLPSGLWEPGGVAWHLTRFRDEIPIGMVQCSRSTAAFAVRHDLDTLPCPIPWPTAPAHPCLTSTEVDA